MNPFSRNPVSGPATPNNYFLLSGSLVLKNMSLFYSQMFCQSVPMYMISPVGSLMFEHSISLLVCHARCSIHLDIPVISKQYLSHVVIYSKTCLKWPHKKRRPKFAFKTDYHLMQVKRIAECLFMATFIF